MAIQKYLLIILAVIIFSTQYSKPQTKFDYKVKSVSTNSGRSHGFYISRLGRVITDYSITKGYVSGTLHHSANNKEQGIFEKYPLEGFSILVTSRRYVPDAYEHGDSDQVDVGDEVQLGGSVYGKILARYNNYNQYHYPCLTANFPADTNSVGRPVLDIHKRVIGIYINYKGNYLIVPINRIKSRVLSGYMKNRNVYPGYERFKKDKQTPVAMTQYGGNPDYQFGIISDIGFDQKNNLYVVDELYKEVKKIPLSGLSKELSENKSVVKRSLKKNSPSSLAVTYAGVVYVLDRSNKQIIVYNSDLNIIKTLTYNRLAGFNPVKIRAFGDELFAISSTGRYNELFHLDFDKVQGKILARRMIVPGLKWQINRLIDMAYENNHFYWLYQNIYKNSSSHVKVINKNRNAVQDISIMSAFPSSVSVYENKCYVFDKENQKISIHNKDGQLINFWSGDISTKQGSAQYVKISPAGIVAVVYRNNSHIRLFQMNGDLIKNISVFSDKGKELESPLSVAVNSNNRLFEVNGSSTIHNYNLAQRSKQFSEVKYLLSDDFSPSFRGICEGSGGKIYVSDTERDRILIYPRNHQSTILKISGRELGELNQPTQLAYSGGMIYILDKANHRVVKVNEEGILQKAFEIKDRKGKLLDPQDITVSPDGKVYILAENKIVSYNGISGVKIPGEMLIRRGTQSYLGYAKGIAYQNGVLFVADTYNNRILKYDTKGQWTGEFGSIGGDMGEFYHPWDIIAVKNRLLIVDKGNHRIVEYQISTQKDEKGDK